MAPHASKVATAEMSVLMAYVRYWVCFLNLQLYKMMVLKIYEVRCHLYFYGIYLNLFFIIIINMWSETQGDKPSQHH